MGVKQFPYHVVIKNVHPEKTFQLLSRHWIIVDGDGMLHRPFILVQWPLNLSCLGEQNEVEGPGVVGEQPILGPGESFNYTSHANLKTGRPPYWLSISLCKTNYHPLKPMGL